MTRYRIAGLIVESSIELPGLILENADDQPAEVTITCGEVPQSLGESAITGPTWEFLESRFLLRIPDVAWFLLSDGCQITVDLAPGAERADAAIFLIGTVFGILLHQRGRIVLHASAVKVNGKAVLFLGASGAGKSTMAAALGSHGYPLISDDLCAISLAPGGSPVVHPDGRRLKLWADAITRLDVSSRQGDPVRNRLEKFYVEPTEVFAAPLSIGAVYALAEARPSDQPGIKLINVAEAGLRLRRNAYRPLLVSRMGQRAQYFQAVAAISNTAGVFDLCRALDFAQMPEIIGWLERHWVEIGLTDPI